jgi:hypothetical protein
VRFAKPHRLPVQIYPTMKNYYWYSIEIEHEKTNELELYLHTIIQNLPLGNSHYITYREIQKTGLLVKYYVNAKNDYLYKFVKHRYYQIIETEEPKKSKLLKVKFN